MEDWKPVPGHIKTPWTDSIDPECPLPEYPRPQMVRQNWKNLNGLWKYGITGKEVTEISDYTGKILVPFAIESSLSGVKQPLGPEQKLWYCRSFQLPETWAKKRVLLHFEAVDWHCACYLNGNRIGDHFGGYVPFSFDITDHMNSGDNELVVTVLDPTDSHWQQKGKQVLSPHMIYYTATSGIWQTVWLEAVNPDNHIQSFRLTPDIDSAELSITVNSLFPGDIRISAFADKKKIGTIAGASDRELKMPVVTPRVWSPDDPFLYDLQVELLKEGVVVDSVESYFAMRKISITQGHSGRKRIFLNNQPIFLHGPLDQGYWPDSGMTPPCEDSMLFDIEKTKELGFNMTRKHIKVE
ncbi:hypothetical protein KKA14_11550, partial [bacterium]|nr:hypothetical protein [bacterium]